MLKRYLFYLETICPIHISKTHKEWHSRLMKNKCVNNVWYLVGKSFGKKRHFVISDCCIMNSSQIQWWKQKTFSFWLMCFVFSWSGCTQLWVFRSFSSLLQVSHSLGVKRLMWAYSFYGNSRGATKQAKACNTFKDTSVSFSWPKKITCPNSAIRT